MFACAENKVQAKVWDYSNGEDEVLIPSATLISISIKVHFTQLHAEEQFILTQFVQKIKCRLKSGIIQMATARSVKVQLPTAGLKGQWLEIFFDHFDLSSIVVCSQSLTGVMI